MIGIGYPTYATRSSRAKTACFVVFPGEEKKFASKGSDPSAPLETSERLSRHYAGKRSSFSESPARSRERVEPAICSSFHDHGFSYDLIRMHKATSLCALSACSVWGIRQMMCSAHISTPGGGFSYPSTLRPGCPVSAIGSRASNWNAVASPAAHERIAVQFRRRQVEPG